MHDTRPDPVFEECFGDCGSGCYDCEQDAKAAEPCDDCGDRGYTVEVDRNGVLQYFPCGGSCNTKLTATYGRIHDRLLAAKRGTAWVGAWECALSQVQKLMPAWAGMPHLAGVDVELAQVRDGEQVQLLAEATKEVAS